MAGDSFQTFFLSSRGGQRCLLGRAARQDKHKAVTFSPSRKHHSPLQISESERMEGAVPACEDLELVRTLLT